MATDTKRFYIGNLSSSVSEADLEKLFKKFGQVEKIEQKTKTDVEGNVLTNFAFITLKGVSDDGVAKCIQKLNNSVWKKQSIKVQQAQESFLTRLQREREEASSGGAKLEIEKKAPLASQAQAFFDSQSNSNKRKVFGEDDFNSMPVKKSKKADEKAVVDFNDDESDQVQVNRLERTKQVRVYHSSDDESDDENVAKRPPKRGSTASSDILSKLEKFDGGFWNDEEVSIEPIPTLRSKPTEAEVEKVENKATPFSFGGKKDSEAGDGGSFSLLSAFSRNVQEPEKKEEESHDVTEAFAFKLKEKAVIDAAKGNVEAFFFVDNDTRFKEADNFLKLKESLTEVRTKYEEKRPILASIMKKKMKNRAKKMEKASFGGVKKRKFNHKFSKNSKRNKI